MSNGMDSTKLNRDLDVVIKKDPLIKRERDVIEDMYVLRNIYSHRNRKKYIAIIEEQILSDADRIYRILQYQYY